MSHGAKTALVIGGSNGLGYALVLQLLEIDYQRIIVLDKVKPESDNPKIQHFYLDLSKGNLDILEQFNNINTLIITAGFGRIASFNTFSEIEIKNIFQVNTVSIIQIIRYFYNKIKSDEQFYCAIISSISGIVSSPLFSLYGATKSALYRFIESINIELEKEGSQNRILNVCPGMLQGTSFYGDKTDVISIKIVANTILELMKKRKTLFIPQYDEIYHKVIDRYLEDSYHFGLESYDYKLRSGRINTVPSITIGYLSGTFDLFHIGHLNLLRQAKEYCDYLVVGVHRDALHKGKETFIPFKERCEIVKSIKYVDRVIESKFEDADVYEELRYNFLFVGSDYKGTARFEKYEKYFEDKNVKIIYFPYTKETNSTKLRMILEDTLKANIVSPPDLK